MSALMRDAGMSTRVCLAVTALRIRVSMSAIGSVISLNLRFGHWSSGQLANSIRPITNLPIHQLLFVTPVTSPSSASLRKHRRHSANFRM